MQMQTCSQSAFFVRFRLSDGICCDVPLFHWTCLRRDLSDCYTMAFGPLKTFSTPCLRAGSPLLLSFATLLQRTSNIRELALLKLRLPENRIRIVEAVLDPAVFLDVVQVDETTRVRVAMGSSKNTPPAQLEGLVVFQFVLVLCVEHTVGEGLSGADTEKVAGEARAVAVDVVESGAFLRGYACAHCSLGVLLDEKGRECSGEGETRTILRPMPLYE